MQIVVSPNALPEYPNTRTLTESIDLPQEFLELIKKVILESVFIQMLVKIVSFELNIGDQIALLILFGVRNVESPKHTSSVSCKIMFGNEDSTFTNTES